MTLNRWAAVFGILAAVLLVVAVLALPGDTPDGDAPAQDWVDFVQDHETVMLARAYFFVGTALSLVAFYALGLRPRLGEADPVDRALAGVGAAATLLAAGSLIVAALIGASVGAAHKFGDVPVDGATAALLDNLVYGAVVLGAALPAGTLMGVVAIQTWRRNVFARWVLWLSVLGIIGMLTSLVFLPFALFPIWLIAVSVPLFRGDRIAGERA